MYDLRHHAITGLLEDESVSERTVIELAGHVSRAMLERYSHIRMRTKREAVDALAKKSVHSVPVGEPIGAPRSTAQDWTQPANSTTASYPFGSTALRVPRK